MPKLIAGIAEKNATLFRRIGVPLGDPAAWIDSGSETLAIVRDLEMDRVRQKTTAASVSCPAEHAPQRGLSGDRETATAEAVAEWFRKAGIKKVDVDRTLPYIYAYHLTQVGITLRFDPELGVLDRRMKSEEEIVALTAAQNVTETVMRELCETVASSSASADGTLVHDGETLTSERIRSMAAIAFLERGFSMGHGAIVATAPHVADCHHAGTGPLRTGVPVIIDLFPRDDSSRYWGDCTRTVVHGQASDVVLAMHRAVVDAKRAASEALRPGVTGASVHEAAEDMLKQRGFDVSRGTITEYPSIQHGTGHGIGLDVHEPILLDHGGGEILLGEVFTIEPGLYGRKDGGVRVEDMLVVTEDGCKNLNQLPEGLDWKP